MTGPWSRRVRRRDGRIRGRREDNPGPAVASIPKRQLDSMTSAGRARLGPVVGRANPKVLLAVDPVEGALPLERLYYLQRGESVARWLVAESSPPDPALLLASSFVWYLDDGDALIARLDAAATLASSVRVFRVDIPASVSAAEVATRLTRHLEAT